MKSILRFVSGFTSLVIITLLAASSLKCPPPQPVGDCKGDSCFSIDSFAANIKKTLTGNCVGYGFVIFYRDTLGRMYAEGLKRTQANGGPLNFDVFSKVQLASLSKTVSAVALLQILARKNLPTTEPVKNYLPGDWTLGSNIDRIIFRQLLRHESGIRNSGSGCDGHTYDELKCKMQKGVSTDSIGVFQYNNQNTALLRVIIPKLLGFPHMPAANDAITAANYIRYVQDSVLGRAQITKSQCYPDTSSNQFYYRWPYANTKGAKFGDHTLYAGATGWFVSVTEYASMINKLFNTEILLSKSWRDTMNLNNLGCFDYGANKYKWHNGFTGDSSAAGFGVVNTCWMYYPLNNVSVACFVNSDTPDWFPNILAMAYDRAWVRKP